MADSGVRGTHRRRPRTPAGGRGLSATVPRARGAQDVLAVGILSGLLAGRVLWRVGERRAATERLAQAFRVEPEDALASESSPAP